MEEEKVGVVVKYFAKPGVAAVFLEGQLRVGERIHIKGHTTDLEQTVESMQIENEPVDRAKAKDDVGIKVKERVRPNDDVYKIVES